MKYCSRCGKEIDDALNFCMYCGEKNILSKVPSLKVPLPKESLKLSKGKKIVITSVIVIVLISCISIGIIAFLQNSQNYNTNYTTDNNNWNTNNNNNNNQNIVIPVIPSPNNNWTITIPPPNDNNNQNTNDNNGNTNLTFTKLDGTKWYWTIPYSAYYYYVNLPHPTETVSFYNSNTGETYHMLDFRPYVQPDYFNNIIYSLTTGENDKQFIQEVVNFKDQLVTYGSLGDKYYFPVETLVARHGRCGDTSILIASLLKSGNNQAHYGLTISIWYCDANHITQAQAVNHVIVEVDCLDGSKYFIETTAISFSTYTYIWGWKYDV